MDANANLFLHLIRCLAARIQRKISANVNTYMHSDLLTSGFACSYVEDVQKLYSKPLFKNYFQAVSGRLSRNDAH